MKFYKNLAFITALLVDARPQAAMADNRVNSLSNKHKYDFDYFKMLEWERPLAPSYKKGKMKMKNSLLIVFISICTFNTYAKCNLKNSNDILELVKKNHPSITFNEAKGKALESTIEVAGQRPNPELDAESTVGDSIEGNIYRTSVSLKHTFELGGKRDSRINVARNTFKTGMAVAEFENQQTIIDTVIKLHRLRQVYELIPLYKESLDAFNKILRTIKKRKSLSPEQQVEGETLELAVNDYKLKISQLNSEKMNLTTHLSFFMGANCIIPRNALPFTVNLSENFNSDIQVENYSKLKIASLALELAKSNLDLEKSNSYPDLQIGPTYEYEKLNVSQTNTVGIALTMDLPILNINGGGRAKASKDVLAASLNLRNIKQESKLDIQSWVQKYNQYKDSLKTIANKEKLEKKHKKIESLFKRGIISTSLVIESHRQLIEFFNTRFEFENGATEALWNIYKLNGEIENKKL